MTKKFNSIKHGLLRKKILLMPDESRYLFNKLNQNLIAVWQPGNMAEKILVEQLTYNYWRLKRAFKLEAELLEIADNSAKRSKEKYIGVESYAVEYLDLEKFEKFSRYLTSIQRQILRILHELERLQALRNGQNVPIPTAVDVDIQGGGD